MIEGHCTCQAVHFRLRREPMFVHCCHCTWCQRETGAAFALNGIIEPIELDIVRGDVAVIETPTIGAHPQRIRRCPKCQVALWSSYGEMERVFFVRIGTLIEARRFQPDIHIYTSTKQPWLALGAEIPAVEEYYDREKYWPADALERYRQAAERVR